MTRTEIIQHFIDKNKYHSYLEIGVQNGVNMKAINANLKVGVDPDTNAKLVSHRMTSDDFFKQNVLTFDCIFIDGLHEFQQVYKDIINSLECLQYHGTIICHDCLPFDEDSQRVPRITKRWVGDVWKAWVKLRHERSDLKMHVVDTDCGVGIIQLGSQEKTEYFTNDYKEFEKNKKYLLNLITIEEFKELYK